MRYFALGALVLSFSSWATDAVTVVTQPVPQTVVLDGTIQAVNQGTVAAQTSGRVVGLHVDVNDVVKQGDILLEISAQQQSAALDAALAEQISAEAQNRDAQAQVKRYRKLFPQGAISQDQMDSAEARARSSAAAVKAAIAAVAQAKESLGYTSIRAPYAGVVTQRHVELGETVAPGTPLLSGFSLNQLRVETDIPQRYQQQIHSAEQFRIRLDDGTRLTPEQYTLFSYADPQSHSFKVRLELAPEQGGLYPGMWVKAELQLGARDILLIPAAAVIRRGELSAVYRIDGERRILNPIRVGQQFGDQLEVLSGLEAGDQIALQPFATKEP